MPRATAARTSLLSIFFELMVATWGPSDEYADPAPWIYIHWMERSQRGLPPWHPQSQPPADTEERRRWEAMRDLADRYRTCDNRDKLLNDKNVAEAKKLATQWLKDEVEAAKLNSRLDALLAEEGITPMTMANENFDGIIPIVNSPVPAHYGAIAVEFFGEEACFLRGEILHPHIGAFVRGFVTIVWNRWRMTFLRESKRLEATQTALEDAKQALETLEAPTYAEFKTYVSCLEKVNIQLTRWQQARPEDCEKARSELENLDAALLGVDPEAFKRLPPALQRAWRFLPSKADRERLEAQVQVLLKSLEDSEGLDTGERPEEVDYSAWHEGTEWLGEKNVEELSQMIGLPSASMPGLNTTEPASPVDSWTAEGIAAMAAPDAVPLALFLHQWQGIVKMVYNMMSYKNTLLMDGVGIGKTAQAICSILMYDYIARVQAEGVVPPVFEAMKAGKDPLKRKPHVIVLPPGLVIQWELELHRFLVPRSYTIVPYQGKWSPKNREAFWQLVDASESPVIILAAHAAVLDDAQNVLKVPTSLKMKDMFTELARSTKAGVEDKLRSTLFDPARSYGVVIVDEVHAFRKKNPRRLVISALIAKGRYTIGITATPIITDPSDMVFLGRLLRFQGFDSESQTELRKAFTRAQGVARKDRKEAKKALQIARAYVTGKMSEKAEDTHVRKAAKQWISSMRPLLAEHIIRRSITSKGPGGAPISNLKMYHQVYIHCELTEEERFVQLTVADELTEQEVQVDKKANAFYLKIRRALLHHGLGQVPGHTLPANARERPYSEHPSTKISLAVDIVKYHHGKACAPPLIGGSDGDTGYTIPTEAPPGWMTPPNAPTDKIFMYLAWPDSNWLVGQALDEAGIKYMEITGKDDVASRAKLLEQFRDSTDTYVCLLSSVGNCGLNLAFANIMIIVDNMWSAQEVEQLIGRVWRHGQQKEVIAYFCIAIQSSDIFLSNLSLDKGYMHKVLIGMPHKLIAAFGGVEPEIVDIATDESECEAPPPKKGRASRTTKPATRSQKASSTAAPPSASGRRTASVAVQRTPAHTTSVQQAGPSTTRRPKKSVKSPETVPDEEDETGVALPAAAELQARINRLNEELANLRAQANTVDPSTETPTPQQEVQLQQQPQAPDDDHMVVDAGKKAGSQQDQEKADQLPQDPAIQPLHAQAGQDGARSPHDEQQQAKAAQDRAVSPHDETMRDAHSVEQASSPQQQGLPDHVPQDAENQPPDNADDAREEEERNASVDPDTQWHPRLRTDPFDEGSSPHSNAPIEQDDEFGRFPERPLMTLDDLDNNPPNATRDGHKRGRSTPGSDDGAPKKARTERASSSSSHWTSEESSDNEYILPEGSGRARTAARNPAGADSEDEPPAAQAASTSAAVGLGENRPTAVPNLVRRSIRGRPTREATGRGVDRRPATVTRRGR